MPKETFDSIPDCLTWQGETLYLVDIQNFTGKETTPTWKQVDNGLEGMTRFSYGTWREDGRIEAVKLMQFSWHGGCDIDWQALETENKGE